MLEIGIMVSTFLIILIMHRVGTIVILVGVSVMPVLPIVFSKETDYAFRERAFSFLLWFARLGLTILVITGILRLTYGIPALFWLKLIFIITNSLFLLKPLRPGHERYSMYSITLIILLLTTAGIGLYL